MNDEWIKDRVLQYQLEGESYYEYLKRVRKRQVEGTRICSLVDLAIEAIEEYKYDRILEEMRDNDKIGKAEDLW